MTRRLNAELAKADTIAAVRNEVRSTMGRITAILINEAVSDAETTFDNAIQAGTLLTYRPTQRSAGDIFAAAETIKQTLGWDEQPPAIRSGAPATTKSAASTRTLK